MKLQLGQRCLATIQKIIVRKNIVNKIGKVYAAGAGLSLPLAVAFTLRNR
jgi:hypothetical protein